MSVETTFGNVRVFDGLPVHQRVVVFTDEQIKNLPEAPVVVIPQLESGQYIIPILAIYSSEIDETNGNTYTNIDTDAFMHLVDSLDGTIIGYIPNASPLQRIEDFLGGAVTSRMVITPLNAISNNDWGLVPNVFNYSTIGGSINLVFDNNGAGPLEDGFETNLLRISMTYLIYERATGLFI